VWAFFILNAIHFIEGLIIDLVFTVKQIKISRTGTASGVTPGQGPEGMTGAARRNWMCGYVIATSIFCQVDKIVVN
jgi:hypothetical protein